MGLSSSTVLCTVSHCCSSDWATGHIVTINQSKPICTDRRTHIGLDYENLNDECGSAFHKTLITSISPTLSTPNTGAEKLSLLSMEKGEISYVKPDVSLWCHNISHVQVSIVLHPIGSFKNPFPFSSPRPLIQGEVSLFLPGFHHQHQRLACLLLLESLWHLIVESNHRLP